MNGRGGFGGGEAGNATGFSAGGGGAGFGGALFVRSGTVDIARSRFTMNIAAGGEGGLAAETSDGLGKGGAIFALHDLGANENGNNQGMPAALPVVTGCANVFELNQATHALDTDTDNPNVFGTSQSALEDPCPEDVAAPVPLLSSIALALLGGLLAIGGWLGVKRRR
jgi:hypothetical protein